MLNLGPLGGLRRQSRTTNRENCKESMDHKVNMGSINHMSRERPARKQGEHGQHGQRKTMGSKG
jgi:hypothetical protein